ncbi:tryptophan-rich sensory protein [Fibrella sp. HMF5335]|uniref:Tryptophan-rich sensory protein n=1 Tax=Fibrella rubiginis TaxID=2817060 RepID=A0A939K4U5_9BACT|nr:tryptophan-rich sensory protein [Fibrella rubiginis]MBO0936566.1 tryptophan-rich sensory protein [Fibrella rubiginis]
MENTKISRWATAVLVVGSIIGTSWLTSRRNRKKSSEVAPVFEGELDANLTTPANATFPVMWSSIYAGTLGLAVHQALPSQVNNERYEKASPWLVANYVLNAVYGSLFSHGEKSARVAANVVTIAQLPTVLGLHQALEVGKTEVDEPEKTFQRTVGLYAGWTTVASGLAVTNLLIEAGYRVGHKQAEPYAVGALSILGGIGLAVSKKLNDPYYLLPFVAGFTGVAAKQYGRNDLVAGVAGALALTVAGLFAQRIQEAKTDVTEQGNDAVVAQAALDEMAEEPYYIDLD